MLCTKYLFYDANVIKRDISDLLLEMFHLKTWNKEFIYRYIRYFIVDREWLKNGWLEIKIDK